MYYQTLSNIQVQQIPTAEFPNRNRLLVFSFLHEYDGMSTWQDLTQTMRLVIPKNVRIKAYRITGQPFSVIPNIQSSYVQLGNVTGQTSNLGGFDNDEPVFLRGDMIKMNIGYRAILLSGSEATYWTGQNGIPDLFSGFIAAVHPKLTFTLECEDAMWLCKQIPTPAKNWGDKTLQQVVTEIISSATDLPMMKRYRGYVALSVNNFSAAQLKFNVGNLTTQRDTLAAFLARIKGQYMIDCYFRGNELRMGYLHYVPADNVDHTFTFQKNILNNDKLVWRRKDDVRMSVIVKSNYRVAESGVTLGGQTKTKNRSTEIMVYHDEASGTFKYIKKEKGKDYPAKYIGLIGEKSSLEINSNVSDPEALFKLALPLIEKQYYDGFRGSFTTFGMPYVKHGDTVTFINPKLPELNGSYKVKAVHYYGGFDDGFRQEIFLDYRV